MYIAQQLKEKNIAEYLIYMWQVEDLIRAHKLDIDLIEKNIISQYEMSEENRLALKRWYEDLIDMMRAENVVERGHLQINRNVIINLTDLHNILLNSPNFPFYSTMYYKALPFIVELRTKSERKDTNELVTCFEALYGVILLKLQKKTVSVETTKAVEIMANLISMLAGYYDKQKKGELDIE